MKDPIAFYRETIRRLQVIITRVAREEGVDLHSVQFLTGAEPEQDRIILMLQLDGEILHVPLEQWDDLVAKLGELAPEADPPEA